MFYSYETNLQVKPTNALSHDTETECVTVQVRGLLPVPQAKTPCDYVIGVPVFGQWNSTGLARTFLHSTQTKPQPNNSLPGG